MDEVPLQAAATLRTASFLGFWVQLPLTLVSAVVLFFSLAFANTRMSAPDPTKYFTLAGIVFAFISTFFAASFRRTARALLDGQPVRRSAIVSNILRNNTINFLGIGVTLVGLQAAVGGLVAKTLLAAPNPYQAGQSASAVVSLDVFSLQASTNTILAHFLSLIFSSIMLRAINRTQAAPASY